MQKISKNDFTVDLESLFFISLVTSFPTEYAKFRKNTNSDFIVLLSVKMIVEADSRKKESYFKNKKRDLFWTLLDKNGCFKVLEKNVNWLGKCCSLRVSKQNINLVDSILVQ